MERWKIIPEAPRYAISDYGRVMNRDTGRILRPGGDPYDVVGLICSDGSRIYRKIHVLVISNFVCPKPPGYEVNHKDLNKRNNHVSNLEWVTHAHNIRHAAEIRRFESGRVYFKVEKPREKREKGFLAKKRTAEMKEKSTFETLKNVVKFE